MVMHAQPSIKLLNVVVARPRAFTLIELLVVVAVLGILIAILLPALGMARRAGRSTVCLANLHSIGQALTAYESDHAGHVVPSYNMTGTSGLNVPLDGWGPILERDGYFEGHRGMRGNALVCPEAKDVAGIASGQTGADLDNPKGWMEWPNLRTASGNMPVTIIERRFDAILRVAYWINADNPIGGVVSVTPDLFYTGSVGYGPGSNGLSIRNTKAAIFARPAELVAVADGLYAGRQRDARFGTPNSRIGYRHPGGVGTANTAFADGHAAPIEGTRFPRAARDLLNPKSAVIEENKRSEPTVYANPARALRL